MTDHIYIRYYQINFEGISIDFATTDKEKAFDTERLKDQSISLNRYPDVHAEMDVYSFDGEIVEEYYYDRNLDKWVKV